MPSIQLYPILGLRGVNELQIPGIVSSTTRSSRNVWYRDGQAKGRKGLATLFSGQSTAADSIDGLFPYTRIGGTKHLMRITPTTVAEFTESGGAWNNITGTALTGTANNIVDATVIDDTFIFTNGEDRIRKWAGSGNTAEIAGGVDIWSKTIEAYVGFLMAGNWSDDGSTFQGVEIIFADDWDNSADWAPCETNIITVDETPGDILALAVLDRSLMVYKRDAVVKITFVAGSVRFRHDLMPFDLGILAPNSLVTINRVGHIFLATDKQLYLNDGVKITPIPDNVRNSLRTMDNTNAPFAAAAHDTIKNVYSLFYPNTSGSDSLDGRIDFNYRTGEFGLNDYDEDATDIHRVTSFAFTNSASTESVLVAASDDLLVYRLDTTHQDNSTKFTREWTSDWTNFSFIGDKYFHGCNISMKRSVGARVRVSVAQDFQKTFRQAKVFDLRGVDTVSDEVIVQYNVTPILGHNFNIKVEFFHDTTNAETEMKYVIARYTPISTDIKENQPESQSVNV